MYGFLMSHPEQRQFFETVRIRLPQYFADVRVLDIGSLDINGSLRTLFVNCDYTGVDLGEGPGVDIVAEGQDLEYADNSFETVVSAECFEHNPYWKETFENMHRMCSGLVVFSCATEGRAEHGTTRTSPSDSPFTAATWDYYKNLTQGDFEGSFHLESMFSRYAFKVNNSSHDLYFWGLVR